MTTRGHIRLLLIATLVRAAFLMGGLPSYYQQYSTRFMVWFDILVLVPITGVAYVVLRGVRPERRLKVSVWIAFYFTVPLAIYDWLYCGVFLGHGMKFLSRFWYLSVYYAIPWVLMPMVVLVLDRRGSRVSSHSPVLTVSGPGWITGGAFGFEGGRAATAATATGIATVWLAGLAWKRRAGSTGARLTG